VPSHAIPAAYPADRLGFGDSGLQTLADELNSRVTAIHPDLQWEFARGTRSRHALVVSPGGNPRVRVAAARWYAEAPRPTRTGSTTAAARPTPTRSRRRSGSAANGST